VEIEAVDPGGVMSTHDESHTPVASGGHGIRAAQYVRAAQSIRTSTERQPSSIESQIAVIHDYAKQHGFVIVKTYIDKGKSGSHIEERDAMKRLLEDVHSDQAEFQAILVQDNSRWGRFQDPEESTHYEDICRRSGIQVIYCAEQSEKDGSTISTTIEGIRRVMAGESHREDEGPQGPAQAD
jgi:DNA invertase Pin-like site-specific DNA recombinase